MENSLLSFNFWIDFLRELGRRIDLSSSLFLLEHSLLFLLRILGGELKNFCFNLTLRSCLIFCLIEFPFLLIASSSTFSTIYISFAITLVGSRKALRSRLGYLVSWVLRSEFSFYFLCLTLFMLIYNSIFRSDSIQVIFYFSVC